MMLYLSIRNRKLSNRLQKIFGDLKLTDDDVVYEDRLSQIIPRLSFSKDYLLLDTNDDVAELCQRVYELYLIYDLKRTIPLIAFLSEKTRKRHPTISFWVIDGHAALDSIQSPEDPKLKAIIKGLFVEFG